MKNVKAVRIKGLLWHTTKRLGEELVFEIRPVESAAKFLIKSSLLFLLPNLYSRADNKS